MSTKWNNSQKLQKTPAVCKKGPKGPGPTSTTFFDYILQCYASWSDSDSPLEQKISGMCNLLPDHLAQQFFGRIQGTRAALEIYLVWDAPTLTFHHTVELWIEGFFTKSVGVNFIDPPPLLPFTAGLFTWDPPGLAEHVESKVYS